MPTNRRSWLKKRFVLLSEVLGYCLSGAIFIGIIVTLFIRVDVLVHATAELRPLCLDVTHPQDFLLVEYLVANGESVVKGQPIAHVLLGEATQKRQLARRQLLESVSILRDPVVSESGSTLRDLDSALASLPPIEDPDPIKTTRSGVVRYDRTPWLDGVLPGETVLALVCDLQTLEMRARVGGSERADKIATGQRVRIFIDRLDAVVIGEVVKVDRDGDDVDLRIEFSMVPLNVQEFFRDTYINEPDGDSLLLQADIIVGSRSLFMEMFGRGGSNR